MGLRLLFLTVTTHQPLHCAARTSLQLAVRAAFLQPCDGILIPSFAIALAAGIVFPPMGMPPLGVAPPLSAPGAADLVPPGMRAPGTSGGFGIPVRRQLTHCLVQQILHCSGCRPPPHEAAYALCDRRHRSHCASPQ